MVTYADAATLLTAFFILLRTFPTVDSRRLSPDGGGSTGILSTDCGSIVERVEPPQTKVNDGLSEKPQLDWQQGRNRWICREEGRGVVLTMEHVRRGCRVTVPFERVFKPGQAGLTDSGMHIMHQLAKILNNTHNRVEVRCVAPAQPDTEPAVVNIEHAERLIRYFVDESRLTPYRFAITARGDDLLREHAASVVEVTILGAKAKEVKAWTLH